MPCKTIEAITDFVKEIRTDQWHRIDFYPDGEGNYRSVRIVWAMIWE